MPDRVMQEVFALDRGHILVEVPARISAEDFEDIQALFAILERKLRRRIRESSSGGSDYAI